MSLTPTPPRSTLKLTPPHRRHHRLLYPPTPLPQQLHTPSSLTGTSINPRSVPNPYQSRNVDYFNLKPAAPAAPPKYEDVLNEDHLRAEGPYMSQEDLVRSIRKQAPSEAQRTAAVEHGPRLGEIGMVVLVGVQWVLGFVIVVTVAHVVFPVVVVVALGAGVHWALGKVGYHEGLWGMESETAVVKYDGEAATQAGEM